MFISALALNSPLLIVTPSALYIFAVNVSYIFGASLGTSLFGIMVDHIGWHGGFYLLGCGIICCIIFCWLSHRGAIELERHRAAYIKEH